MDSAAGWPIEDEFSVPELGATFSPFDLSIKKGEDILDRIMSVTGPDQGVCVIVATGGVSAFTVKQPGASSPLVYQGITQILRLQGLYLPMEKGGPLTGRLKFIGGLVNRRPKSVIEGDVCGRLVAEFAVQVSLGSFKVDFEKLQQLNRDRILEAAPPILERERVIHQSTTTHISYVPIVGQPPPPLPPPPPSELREVRRSRPHSDWFRMCNSNSAAASGFLAPEAGPLVPPYQLRHPPPPPTPTMAERIEQLEKDSTELKDQIQQLKQLEKDSTELKDQIQQLKREAVDREERAIEREKRLKQEFCAMVQQQLTSASTTGFSKLI